MCFAHRLTRNNRFEISHGQIQARKSQKQFREKHAKMITPSLKMEASKNKRGLKTSRRHLYISLEGLGNYVGPTLLYLGEIRSAQDHGYWTIEWHVGYRWWAFMYGKSVRFFSSVEAEEITSWNRSKLPHWQLSIQKANFLILGTCFSASSSRGAMKSTRPRAFFVRARSEERKLELLQFPMSTSCGLLIV